MNIIKRSGKEVPFDLQKITIAISKANNELDKHQQLFDENIYNLSLKIKQICFNYNRALSVEEIQDIVENELIKTGNCELAKKYITYRYKRALVRQSNTTDAQIMSLLELDNEEIKQENSNKNPTINSVQRDYMAGEVSKDISKRFLLPDDIVKAHEEGIIHFHDMDYYSQHMHNCCLVNLEDMLQNGTMISRTMIDKPNSFSTACNIATQIIAQVASSQYGGQSISLSHLAPFVDISRKKFYKNTKKYFEDQKIPYTEEKLNAIVEEMVLEEVKKGVQTIQYQVITLMTTNGQAPFVTVFMYLNEVDDPVVKKDLALIIEETLRQRIIGVKNEKGSYITPAFPKLIYVLEEDNIHEDSKYWYLTKLAAKCSAKRLVPDYISEKIMLQLKENNCYPCMGCRSFLTPDRFTDNNVGNISKRLNYTKGKQIYYGRFNQGVVTINLVDVALSAIKESKIKQSDVSVYKTTVSSRFWRTLDERLELCHKALRLRHERLLGTTSDVAPILWQYGGLARLDKGEKIDNLLYDGYSTISLGYAGIYECVMALINQSHTSEDGQKLAIEIMQFMNDKCLLWKSKENIDYSIYGTPLESTTYKFAKCLQKRFGKIPNITDKNYITNSYHICVREKIDAFEKLKLESKFQELSPGGAISYIEVPDMKNNLDAVLSVIKYIYDNIMYAELNTKSDYCHCCEYDGEIVTVKDKNGKLVWECPNCHNRDQTKMNVARRTCGYIGTEFWNSGRTEEISDRVLHL